MSLYLDDIIVAPEPKRVLLTGISGSIGVHFLAHFLHNTNWYVVGTDSFNHRGWSDRLNEVVKDHPDWNGRWHVVTHDLTAPFSEMTKRKIGHIDYIISMASLSDVEASIQEPVPFVQNNVALILNLLQYAREARPEAFIQISTDEVYGPTTGKNDGYKEWDAKIPSNPYAASKSCQEELAIAWWRAFGVPLIITNTMNNFGEMQSATKYPVMIQKAVANGEVITIHGDDNGNIGSRSYIHSRNFADAILHILKNVKPHLHVPGEVDKPVRVHIAGDRQLDNLELAQLEAKLMGKELKYELVNFHATRPGHDPHYGLNDDYLRKELCWTPPVSFEDSLAEVIRWQTENDRWIKI